MERGTNLPLLVSVKTVSSSPLSWRACASGSGFPSRVRPCSRRYLALLAGDISRAEDNRRGVWWMGITYSSQALFPSCVPACPIWR